MSNQSNEKSIQIKSSLIKYSPVLILIILLVISTILSPVFLTVGNIYDVLRQQVPYIFIALGVLLTILTGGIDLSPGAILAVSASTLALLANKYGFSSPSGMFFAILIALGLGTGFGLGNGLLVAKLKMAPFIATLAVMTICRGLAYQLTGGSPVRLPDNQAGSAGFVNFGQTGDPVTGIPLAVWVAIAVILVFWFFMKYTSFGRYIVATGSNETAVRLAGINVQKFKLWAYLISGLCAGAAGIFMAARSGIANPASGSGFELTAIASCVIGGASLAGGKGTVGFTIIGVMILALIGNLMNLLSVPAYPQQMLQGAIIIAAVLMNGLETKNS